MGKKSKKGQSRAGNHCHKRGKSKSQLASQKSVKETTTTTTTTAGNKTIEDPTVTASTAPTAPTTPTQTQEEKVTEVETKTNQEAQPEPTKGEDKIDDTDTAEAEKKEVVTSKVEEETPTESKSSEIENASAETADASAETADITDKDTVVEKKEICSETQEKPSSEATKEDDAETVQEKSATDKPAQCDSPKSEGTVGSNEKVAEKEVDEKVVVPVNTEEKVSVEKVTEAPIAVSKTVLEKKESPKLQAVHPQVKTEVKLESKEKQVVSPKLESVETTAVANATCCVIS